MRKIALLDYGAGNLHSLIKVLDAVGMTEVVRDVDQALRADLLILPGVGAFGQAAREIAASRERLRDALEGGLPCIGVCLGMQLLFDRSEESSGDGIGLIAGSVRKIAARRLPQMGWNSIDWVSPKDNSGRAQTPDRLDIAYFANSYACEPRDESTVVAWSAHEGDRFPSVVRKANTIGVQFHPEKSSRAGVDFLRAIAQEVLACS